MKCKQAVVAHGYNPSAKETDVGGFLGIQFHPELHNKF